MRQKSRTRYIYLVIASYLVLALGWILLSDAVLLALVDHQSLVELSTAKGIFFVIVSAAGFYLAMRSLPDSDTFPGMHGTGNWFGVLLQGSTAKVMSRWYLYFIALALTMVMYWVRTLLPEDPTQHPMLILYVLPIVISAILGGFGPGILSTSLALLLVATPLMKTGFTSNQSLQLAFLLVNGTAISALNGLLREALKRLEINRHVLDSIIAGSADAIFVKNRQGVYALVNQAAADLFGKPIDFIIGKRDEDIFDATSTERIHLYDERIQTLTRPVKIDDVLTPIHGAPIHLSSVVGPIRDINGENAGVFGICRDITEQQKIQQLLQTREQRLSRVIDGSEQGYWEWDIQTGNISVSARWMNMLGYAPDEFVVNMDSWLNLIHPEDLPIVQRVLDQHLDLVTPSFTVEARFKTKLDSWHWILSRGKVVERDELGQPKLMSGTHSDIAERKLSELAIREAAVVFDGSHEGILVTNKDKIITKVNQAFTRITGYEASDVIGQKPQLLSSGRQSDVFYKELWQSLEEQGFWRGELWNRRKSGEIYPELLSISAVKDEEGNVLHYVGFFIDISERKQHEAELERVANYDQLTGVPNRQLLSDRFSQSILRSARQDHTCAVCFLDLDDFRLINEKYGNQVGDLLLVGVTANLNKVLRANDTLARLGGDEFVLVLSDIRTHKECQWMLERIQAAIAHIVVVGDLHLSVTASIGVSLYPDDNVDPDTLLRHADQAMFMAKQSGKNRYQLFDPESDRKAQAHRLMQRQMLDALNNGEFELFYQPKVNLQSKAILGMEALIRWRHPLKGIISPADFLPHIQGTELEIVVGEWVLETALKQMASWRMTGLDLQMSVNISSTHLLHPGFYENLMRLLSHYVDILPQRLELEILESTAIGDMEQAIGVVSQCRRLGVRFALDDFGTGYSSLSYLRRLPVDVLKIDQSFVRDMLKDPDDLRIVEGVIQLANVFRKEVIAEGVETVAHGNLLDRMGCHLAQGYGIAKPMPANEVSNWCQDWNHRHVVFG